MVLNPPKIPCTFPIYVGHHAGIVDTDLMIPILLRGEQLKHLYDREEMWLYNLYTSIPELSFENLEPARYSDDICRSWLEYDLYSSYVIRLWTGAGFQYQEQSLEALVQARLQIDLGKMQFNYGGQFTQEGWEINTKELVYQINDHLALEWLIPNGRNLIIRAILEI
jgi:hypothetical protein